jgi:hypothetical protein
VSNTVSRSEKYWAKFVQSYNAKAKELRLPRIRTKQKGVSIAEIASGWLSEHEALAMKVEFFASILDDEADLVEHGFNRRKQERAFSRAGVEKAKKTREETERRVLEARRKIMTGRTREPSGRELARLIAAETGISKETVRAHLRKK